MKKSWIVPVGGFLGAGKTTLILAAARHLQQRGLNSAAILNDQGVDLVDTAYARASGLPASEVTGGCFCCRFSDFLAAADQLRSYAPDVIFAEPVGYLLSATRTTWFAGDTGLFAGMDTFGAVDLALVPVWGWGFNLGPGHLDPAGAAEAVRRVAPTWAVPIHWGTLWPVGCQRIRADRFTDPGTEFAELAAESAPATRVRVLEPGGTLTLDDARSESS